MSKKPSPFKPGDKVFCDMDAEWQGAKPVRVVAECVASKLHGSGFSITLVDARCLHCGLRFVSVENVDSAWCRREKKGR